MQRSENSWRLARPVATLLGCCIAMPVVVHASGIDDGMPPPGLYRIDIDGTVALNVPGTAGAQIRERSDGRTGDEVHRSYANGHTSGDIVYKGNGPHTQCIGPRVASAPPELPGCVSQPGTRTKDGWVIKSKCASVASTLVIRKIDAATWEYVTSTTLFQPNAGDMSGLRFLMEQQARNAPTAKEREAAAKALTELPDMQRKMAQGQAESMEALAKMERAAKTPEEAAMIKAGEAQMSGKTPMQEVVGKVRLTRIANICDATPKVK